MPCAHHERRSVQNLQTSNRFPSLWHRSSPRRPSPGTKATPLFSARIQAKTPVTRAAQPALHQRATGLIDSRRWQDRRTDAAGTRPETRLGALAALLALRAVSPHIHQSPSMYLHPLIASLPSARRRRNARAVASTPITRLAGSRRLLTADRFSSSPRGMESPVSIPLTENRGGTYDEKCDFEQP